MESLRHHFKLKHLVQINDPTMRFSILLFFSSLLIFACHTSQSTSKPSGYPPNVGDILPDKALDDPGFIVCREKFIPQYYSVTSGFSGEKPALEAYFRKNFIPDKKYISENGYITIRFVVNCQGKTGRFRMQEIGPDYQPKKFPAALSKHLLELTKNLTGWLPGQHNGVQLDYYQYLTFTIVNGELTQMMP